ncbi:flagellar biosynthetic protein FliR [Rhodohalobacter mucosus]|uniref:Flagellar biosynthetic protein FliR n=1 Tax=Rhodohalobacter mucosus TaxID=2079485 RepID=A0A316TPR0_9BACT|nr:flagellar biosynthetic protein FliR [Rhodohalobacter mucosus]PWN05189.1 flagellar biosynthetic protein FliR [Rhodohalobacter mucosus]
MTELFTVEYILTAFLIFVRVGALMATAPFFSNGSIPVQVKVFFSLILSVMLFPLIPVEGMAIPTDAGMLDVLVAIIKELLVGVVMGLTGQILFAALQIGGELMSLNIGLTFASVVDPVNSTHQSIIGQLFVLLGTFVFISSGGDAYYIFALAHSYEVVPVGTVQAAAAAPLFIEMATRLFLLGVQISAPFMVVLFLMDLSFAIFGRIMPRANIFFIALPLKAGVGFLLLLIVLPFAPTAFERIFADIWMYLDRILLLMGGGN